MKLGLAGRVTRAFANNPVTPILTLIGFLMGALALAMVPREEEPQIRVPLVDVRVAAPGFEAEDAVEAITRPLEDVLAGVEGVDELYSRTEDGRVIASARFDVGESAEDSVLRVIERLGANAERAPPGVADPVVIGRGIEDVAVIVITLAPAPEAADRYDRADMFELAQALRWRMGAIDNVGLTYVVGAGASQVRVEPDLDALARYQVSPQALTARIEAANTVLDLGDVGAPGERRPVLAGRTGSGPQDIANLVVTTRDDRPVYVRDLAEVMLAPPDPGALVWHADADGLEAPRPAASLAIAKRPGANGVEIARQAREILQHARGDLIPDDVDALVVRDYGETAAAKARTLFLQLFSATAVIVVLIGLFVGVREALVVGVVIPTTILLTFFALWAMGYTINRVSLFALIFAIGILVDDAIVVVENITRWWSRQDSEMSRADSAVAAVDEVGNPTIISTLTIIAALLPMIAVSGLMGPYMSPIPANASAAVTLSTLVALTATPWIMLRLARVRISFGLLSGDGEDGGPLGRLYARVAEPVLKTRRRAFVFLMGVGLATLASFSLFFVNAVPVKLLPFDDKDEMQIVLDLPESAQVEDTDRVLREAVQRLEGLPELRSVQIYAGTAGPFNFNGLVRQYYLRAGEELGDVKINLAPPGQRSRSSHAIAGEVRERLSGLDLPEGAAVRIAETPPGPPVLATLLAEIYGPDAESRRSAARQVRAAYAAEPFIVDVDDTIGAPPTRIRYEIDEAALDLHGVSEAAVSETLRAALGETVAGQIRSRHADGARDVVVALERSDRIADERLLALPVMGRDGPVELGALVSVTQEPANHAVFRRNGRPAVMVLGGLAGGQEAPIYGMLAVQERLAEAGARIDVRWRGQPVDPDAPTLLWHGEWEITYTTFRDLGAAFAVAFLIIYAIVVWHFGRLKLPLLIMAPVPLTLLGVILGHWIVGAKFTATSMIGFIALAGIVVRNSILLIEFIEERRERGEPVRRAVIEAGRIRFRPIFLTGVTAMVGAAFILTDPIFRGLAVSLLFGLLSSTILTVLVIPAVYVWMRGDSGDAQGQHEHR